MICETLETTTTWPDKVSANAALTTYGAKAYFYTPEDIASASRLIDTAGTSDTSWGIKLSPVLHTVFPPAIYHPIDNPTREADTIGFMRLNATQFLLRPNICNVSSCHAIGDDYPLGNLAYLMNPYWSCFITYTNKDKLSITGPDYLSGYMGTQNPPNPLTAVNTLLCYTEKGTPSVLISKPYGDYINPHSITRLVEYFTYVLRLRVYLYSGQNKYNADIDKNSWPCLVLPNKSCVLFTPPVNPQVICPSPYVEVIRYQDVFDPLWKDGQTKEMQRGLFYKNAKVSLRTEDSRVLSSMGVNSAKCMIKGNQSTDIVHRLSLND